MSIDRPQLARDAIGLEPAAGIPTWMLNIMEQIEFPRLAGQIAAFDEDAHVQQMLDDHRNVQGQLDPDILKVPYGYAQFPRFTYTIYGYEAYFTAYALYAEVIERHFSLQADLAIRINRASARAYRVGDLPPMNRLDDDMADSRGTLASIKSLDRIWFPHLARAIGPLLDEGIRLVWHCDGNLMQMVPRLIEVGIGGFQGFQYEDGMDYEAICRMKTRDGDDLLIMAGVSVTRTLPFGAPEDVRRELSWLVEHGPKRGLFLACTRSVAPGVPWDNLAALVEGLRYYREQA